MFWKSETSVNQSPLAVAGAPGDRWVSLVVRGEMVFLCPDEADTLATKLHISAAEVRDT